MKVEESGWAWMVCGERLIVWKIGQTAVAKVKCSWGLIVRVTSAQTLSLQPLILIYVITDKECKVPFHLNSTNSSCNAILDFEAIWHVNYTYLP